jgi:hypothetical protein
MTAFVVVVIILSIPWKGRTDLLLWLFWAKCRCYDERQQMPKGQRHHRVCETNERSAKNKNKYAHGASLLSSSVRGVGSASIT